MKVGSQRQPLPRLTDDLPKGKKELLSSAFHQIISISISQQKTVSHRREAAVSASLSCTFYFCLPISGLSAAPEHHHLLPKTPVQAAFDGISPPMRASLLYHHPHHQCLISSTQCVFSVRFPLSPYQVSPQRHRHTNKPPVSTHNNL